MDPKPPNHEDAPSVQDEPSSASPSQAPKETAQDLDFVFEEDAEMQQRYERLKRRLLLSTVFSVVVVIGALFMMVSMYGDIRYWLQDDAAPQELALVDVQEQKGGLAKWRDAYVALSATPDASTAVKISLGRDGEVTEKLRFFRLLEAGNRVFVQTHLPLDGGEAKGFEIGGMPTKTLPGRFVGRVHKMGELRFYESLRDHYNALARPRLLSLARDAWNNLDGAKNPGLQLALQSKDGPSQVILEPGDSFEVVVSAPELMVQMGTKTWPDEASAIERIKSTGLPFIHLPYKAAPLAGSKNPERVVQGVNKQLMHRFLVRPGERSPSALLAQLHEGLEIPADNASLEIGAAVLPRRRVYSAALDKVWVKGDALRIDPSSRVASPGYEVVDGALVQKTWDADGLSLPLAQVQEIRVKRPVLVTRDSLIVLTENLPSQQWPSALAFAILGLFVLGNVVMGRRFWSRYQELRSDVEEET